MASEPIHINDDSEFLRLLDEAADRPVRFERKGVVYRVSIEESAESYDVSPISEGEIDNPFANLTDEEAAAWIADIYEQRRLGTRLNTKPWYLDDDEWEEPSHPFNKSGGLFTDEEVAASLAWLWEHLREWKESGVEPEWGEAPADAVRRGLEMRAFGWDEVDQELVEERYQAALRAGQVTSAG